MIVEYALIVYPGKEFSKNLHFISKKSYVKYISGNIT